MRQNVAEINVTYSRTVFSSENLILHYFILLNSNIRTLPNRKFSLDLCLPRPVRAHKQYTLGIFLFAKFSLVQQYQFCDVRKRRSSIPINSVLKISVPKIFLFMLRVFSPKVFLFSIPAGRTQELS
jgi:hypothetical protein